MKASIRERAGNNARREAPGTRFLALAFGDAGKDWVGRKAEPKAGDVTDGESSAGVVASRPEVCRYLRTYMPIRPHYSTPVAALEAAA